MPENKTTLLGIEHDETTNQVTVTLQINDKHMPYDAVGGVAGRHFAGWARQHWPRLRYKEASYTRDISGEHFRQIYHLVY